MLSQSQATINAIVSLAQEKGYDASPFETDYRTVMTKEDCTTIVNFITQGLIDDEITMTDGSKEKFKEMNDSNKGLRRYVVGLVNDRMRKAKALNGNTTYEAKEPGKLKNSRDPELKALMQCLELENPAEAKAEIQAEIDRRRSELAAANPKKPDINYDALPAHLRAKLGL